MSLKMATLQMLLACLALLVAVVQGQREVFRCDFQSDMCGGQNMGMPADFLWMRQKGMTPSAGTGPDYDHTQGNGDGYYIFVESSDPRKMGEAARYMISNIGSGMRCLRFWYSMIGPHQGQLNVKRSSSDSQNLWSKSGEQKMSMWTQGEVELDGSTMSVVFEALRGGGHQGDTALDDVTVTEGRCSSITSGPMPNMPVPGPAATVGSTGGSSSTGQSQMPGAAPAPGSTCGMSPPLPQRMCTAKARDMHLQPMYLSDYWPLRWPDWFNDTFEAFNGAAWPSNFNEWGLDAMYPAMKPDPMTSLDAGVTDMFISMMWMKPRPSTDAAKVRLMGGANEREGRVEVFHNNEWGTVCGKDFTLREAQVVCKSIGFYGTAEVVRTFGQGSGRIWLSGLSCKPTEMHLSYCCHNRFGDLTSSCSHADDVGVRCLDDFWNKVRITGGPSEMEGRLEVHHNGSWGTVCRDGFGEAEAQVACNSLGYWGNADLLPVNSYTGSGQIWLDGVRCKAHLPHLSHCVHNEFGIHDCTHAQDVAIRCRLLDIDYSCTNGTSGTMNKRDAPYLNWNQGGETARNIEEHKKMQAMHDEMLNNMINGIEPDSGAMDPGKTPPMAGGKDDNDMMAGKEMLIGKSVDELWYIMMMVTEELDRRMKMEKGPMPT